MGMKLFDDVGDEDVEQMSKIEVNKEFAKRYEHNKKREDLQKLEEMKKKGLVDDSASDSESESESDFEDVDDVKNSKDEVKFLDALLKVRNKDPILQKKDVKLFDSSDDDEEEGGERKEKKKKPKYLKDVIAQRLIEKEEKGEDDEDDEDDDGGDNRKKVKSYVEEQEDLRKEVLKAMAEAEKENDVEGEGGELLREKEGGMEEDEDEEVKKKLDEFFGEDEKLDEKDMFLKNFIKNKLWIDKEKGKNNVVEDEFVELSDDEELIEKQEDYERDFNFRFEENASDRVLGHSRFVDGSVRKETNARKNQRERKKERLAQAEIERQEEVKRLKNLKRKEMQEKLNKIKEIAGIENEGIQLIKEDLEDEEDFDPEKFDKKMNVVFGKNYYDNEDDPEFGSESGSDLEKPDFEKEDELLGLPKDWEVIKSNDGFLAERERMMQRSEVENGGDDEVENGGDDDQMQEAEDDDEQPDEGKRRRKRKKSAIKEALDKELEEELYKLDYEDSIGDLKTRFKYREVKPSKYGLKTAEILALDEKELNQYVPLKKLATFAEKEWKVPRNQKEMLYQRLLDKTNQKRKRKDVGSVGGTSTAKGAVEVGVAHKEEPSIDESKLSRGARRRRKMKEKKLSESRLCAYGKIPSGSKKKSKS